jgi:hypothetical protein
MIKASLTPNLLSFITVRRGNWVVKVSVYKTSYILVVGQNIFDRDSFFVKQFTNHNDAADYIELIAKKDEDEY